MGTAIDPGRESGVQNDHVITFKCLVFNKNYKTYKETRLCGPCTRKNSQPMETVPEEAQMLDLLDKDINLSIRNMFKELKENILMNESMRMMSHQIKNINKEYQ